MAFFSTHQGQACSIRTSPQQRLNMKRIIQVNIVKQHDCCNRKDWREQFLTRPEYANVLQWLILPPSLGMIPSVRGIIFSHLVQGFSHALVVRGGSLHDWITPSIVIIPVLVTQSMTRVRPLDATQGELGLWLDTQLFNQALVNSQTWWSSQLLTKALVHSKNRLIVENG